ncbi:MAG TPA: alkaline phosphatase family protein [Methylocella sp.]
MPTKNNKRNQTAKAEKKRGAAQSPKQVGEHARKTHAGRKRAAVPKPVGRAPKKKLAVAAFAPVVPDPTLDNLKKIEHIVVLMMENRSFDHLLGYLTLEKGRTDVDGLTKIMHNSYKGHDYFPKRRTQTVFQTNQDPCHSGQCVAEQLSNNNGGFVSNYALNNRKDKEVDLVMNYYNGETLSVYDQLVGDACICDKWFSSVDGATWPNRLYSVTGQSGGTKDNKKTIPFYNLPSFVRYLDAGKIPWRWYAHRSPATLRLIDSEYRNPIDWKSAHFSFFDRRSDSGGNSFLEDAAQGKLAAVSWIDPDFGDQIFQTHTNENDDHPPVDIMAGQQLVLTLYNAVATSRQWDTTLLVVVYDEHGGLYDHVPPPTADDDRPKFRRYGVRVPSFIISPWVEANKVSHTVFDHTSLIKTILLKFCRRADGSIPDMGARVTHANHLGGLLKLPKARPAPKVSQLQPLVARLAEWHGEALTANLVRQAQGKVGPPKPNDLQVGVKRAREQLRAKGLTEDQP